MGNGSWLAASLRLFDGHYSKVSISTPEFEHLTYGLTCSEHLGLIPPQLVSHRGHSEHVTSYMRPAPHPNDPGNPETDELVADPIADSTVDLWNDTAQKNREVFEEIFRTVPSNVVRDFKAYDVCLLDLITELRMLIGPFFFQSYVPKVKTGHVAPGVSLDRIKRRLAEVKGSLVECPMVSYSHTNFITTILIMLIYC